jgi:hypothetical protein
MLTIYNDIYNEKPTPLLINKKLLYEYKGVGDSCLVNIKRELTRSLVDYRVFQQLQQLNNSFFVIIDYLDCDHYFKVAEVIQDKNTLVNTINVFLKPCKSYLSTSIYNSIFDSCQELVNTINKLIKIVQTCNKDK